MRLRPPALHHGRRECRGSGPCLRSAPGCGPAAEGGSSTAHIYTAPFLLQNSTIFAAAYAPGYFGSDVNQGQWDINLLGTSPSQIIGDPASGEAVITYGWAMAEALADGLSTPKS